MAFFNLFFMRKMAALTMPSLLTVVTFYICVKQWNLLIGIGGMLVALLIGFFMGSLLLSNPFSKMLEGVGILCFNIDSVGVITPFIVKVNSPYILGRFRGKDIKDVFDRESTMYISAPVNVAGKAEYTPNGLKMPSLINDAEYNKARFALWHYPVLIYNEQLGSFITKDFLAAKEKDSFAEHGVLYLNRKMEELTSILRDFGRYVVETLKPKDAGLLGSKWAWIIVIGVIVVVLILFAQPIYQAVMGFMGKGAATVTQVVNPASSATGSIAPR